MKYLTPTSMATHSILALEAAFADRLTKLNVSQIIIDIERESNSQLLQWYLDAFGINIRGLDFAAMTDVERRGFINNYLRIVRLCGTEKGIIELGKALGATAVRITYPYRLQYDGRALYDGTQKYDGGAEYSTDYIDITVTVAGDFERYERIFRQFFETTQPIRIYLNEVRRE